LIVIIINNLRKRIIRYYKSNFNNEYKYSFVFALLLSYFDINIPSESAPIIHYSSGVFLLSLVALCSLTNIIFYLVAILFI
jgi:hypothetical protein